MHSFGIVQIRFSDQYHLDLGTSRVLNPFNKNSALKFWKLHVPNGTAHSACRDPTQATTCLVLVSSIQKSGTGDSNFVKWKGTFHLIDQDNQTGQSGPPSKLVPNILVGPNRNGPFHLIYQPKFPEFWIEWKAPQMNR